MWLIHGKSPLAMVVFLFTYILLLIPIALAGGGARYPTLDLYGGRETIEKVVRISPEKLKLPRTPILRIDSTKHAAGINRVDASADGEIIATASDDGTIRVWTGRGELQHTFRIPITSQNDGLARAVAVSPDGKLVVAAGGQKETAQFVYLFQIETGKLLRVLETLPTVKTFSLELRYSGKCRRETMFYNSRIIRRSELRRFTKLLVQIERAAYKLIGKEYPYGRKDRADRFGYQARSGRLETIEKELLQIDSLVKRRYVRERWRFSYTKQGYANAYKSLTRQIRQRIAVLDPIRHAKYLHCMEYYGGSLQGEQIVAALDLEFSRDGSHLAAGLGGSRGVGGIKVWKTSDWHAVITEIGSNRRKSNSGYVGPVGSLAFGPQGKLATTSLDGYVKVFDREFVLISQRKLFPRSPLGISFSPDGTKIAIGDQWQPRIDVLSSTNLKTLHIHKMEKRNSGSLNAVVWSPDGKFLFAAGQYPKDRKSLILRWKFDEKTAPKEFKGPENTVLDLALVGKNSLSYVTQRPVFGLMDLDGKEVFRHGSGIVDMRGKRNEKFMLSPDARRVRFDLNYYGKTEPWSFDADKLDLQPSPKAAKHLRKPRTKGLRIDLVFSPTVGKRDIKGIAGIARSFVIAPNKKNFVIGAQNSLSRHSRRGGKIWSRSVPGEVWGVNLSGRGSLIVAAYGDGTIRWHRSRDGVELLALFVHAKDKRWVAWTPKGYYAASVGGEKLIGWHVNREWNEAPDFFPVARFRKDFYRPDIVQLILKTFDEEKAIRLANKQAGILRAEEDISKILPPVVDLNEVRSEKVADGAKTVIKLRARSPAGKVLESVEVRIDGRPLAGRGYIVLGPVTKASQEYTVTLNTACKDAVVSVIAKADGRSSASQKIKIKCSGAVVTAKPDLYAILVGISDYPKSGNNDLKLNYAAKDAQDFSKFLKKQKGRYYENVIIRSYTNKEATRDNIIEGLEWLRSKTGEKDTSIIFLAGHGLTDQLGRFFYLPVNVNLKKLISSAIREQDILDPVGRIKGRVLVFLDACHSGAGLKNKGLNFRSANLTRITNGLTDDETGAVLYASSRGSQVSYESEKLKNGVFTRSLLEGLAGKAEDPRFSNGRIETNELDSWLFHRVRQLTNNKQEPIMIKPDAIPHFVVALPPEKK